MSAYPNSSIFTSVFTDFVDSYRANIKIDIIEIRKSDAERIKEIRNAMNRYCVVIEDKFITLFDDVDKAINTVGWQAIGFKTKAECKAQVEKIISDCEMHAKLRHEEDARMISGKQMISFKYVSIETKFAKQWKIRL